MEIGGIDVKRPGNAGYKTMVRRYSGRGSERFWELDFVRGICVMLMVFDHIMYSLYGVLPSINSLLGTDFLSWMQKYAVQYWTWDVRNNVRLVVISTFFILCGISCTLTRGNVRRFIPLALVAAGITCVTSALDGFIYDSTVNFGVLHMLATSILLFAVLDEAAQAIGSMLGKGRRSRIAREALRYFPAAVGVVWLVWLFNGYAEFVQIQGKWQIASLFGAEGASHTEKVIYSILLYVRNFSFSPGDYFPILPWSALVLAGSAIGRCIYHTSAKYTFSRLNGAWNAPVCKIGRHAAIIYILHMLVVPLYMALGACVSMLF